MEYHKKEVTQLIELLNCRKIFFDSTVLEQYPFSRITEKGHQFSPHVEREKYMLLVKQAPKKKAHKS